MVEIRPIEPHEYLKAREIDVSETGGILLRFVDGRLREEEHPWERLPWSEARFLELRQTWAEAVRDGGKVLGGFVGELLVGEAVFRPRLTPEMAQLESLHVSKAFRRLSVARRLTAEVIRLARESGARELYVSATPSLSAVGFYWSMGFRPTLAPHPRSLALEPEDIHMTLPLQAPH